jgi:hypothetical protein
MANGTTSIWSRFARAWLVGLALTALVIVGLAVVLPEDSPAPLAAVAAPAPRFPATLADPEPRALLVAMAQSLPRIRQLETKEASGEVVALDAAGRALDLQQAAQQLRQIKQNLASLSHDGLPTYALIQSIAGDGRLEGWIIFPDGRIAAGRSARKFTGLGKLPDGLDVTRFALSRAPQLKSAPDQPVLDAATDDERGRGSRIAQRRTTLQDTAALLLPGDIGKVLAAGQGRLLILPVRDSGTAPYAALPVAGPGDVAARRWSFVVMQDIPTLASSDFGFDLAALDLRKSVVVGDPDDMRDVLYRFKPLPGARREALAIARDLELAGGNVLIGADATRPQVVSAIDRSNGEGMVYMATHAVSDEKNPLTRGFVVLSKTNLFAGELRVTRFQGWDRNHPLVVLSACQTALGRVFDGGTFGVARTWTNAGAGQVVASLWNVSDAATLKLMEQFALALKAGQSPEQAMQTAQLAALKDYPDDPRLWASFTIIGKPTLASGS